MYVYPSPLWEAGRIAEPHCMTAYPGSTSVFTGCLRLLGSKVLTSIPWR
ncbi:hypothetical protein SCALM49S_08815 [Streptomyces californicus]